MTHEKAGTFENGSDVLLGAKPGAAARLQVEHNSWNVVNANVSYASMPLRIGEQEFTYGLACPCHADSEIRDLFSTPAPS